MNIFRFKIFGGREKNKVAVAAHIYCDEKETTNHKIDETTTGGLVVVGKTKHTEQRLSLFTFTFGGLKSK